MSMDDCTFHSQSGSFMGYIFTGNGVALGKSLRSDIFGLGEGRNFNLVCMCSISGAING